jgi:hypothetical protein
VAIFLSDALERAREQRLFSMCEAYGLLCKAAASPPPLAPRLAGRLYLSQSGWILLDVPNALIRGLFSALNEPGIELPYHKDGQLNGHISVVRKEEVEKAGGPEVFSKDRGRVFHYQLGPVRTVKPPSWDGVSRVWFVEVRSPELEAFRKSYALTPLPNDNKFQFHVTFAVLKTNVLRNHPAAKAAGVAFRTTEIHDPICPHCGEVMGEKSYVPDWDTETQTKRSDGWRHRGPCYDKGAFEIDWPKQAEDDTEVPHDEAKATRSRVEKVIKTLPAPDLYGVWYHPGPPARVRVSLGDWSGIRCDHVKHRLSLIPDLKVEVDAEIGAPREAGWEKLEGRDGGEYNPGEFCPGCDAQCEGDPYDKTCNSCGYRYEEKSAGDDELKLVIDRPKGFKKKFKKPGGGHRTVTYPLDYGYFKGLINPQDSEDCDVFVGAGEGSRHGRYMKGDTMTGTWKEDEFKWYTDLTDAEHAAMMKFYDDLDPELVRDEVTFADKAELLADVRKHAQQAKAAAVAKVAAGLGNWFQRTGRAVRNYGRETAGLLPGQKFTGTAGSGFMSRAGTTLKNTARVGFAPRYPGLDRPALERAQIAAHRAMGGTGLPATVAPRVLDRTRTALANATRYGPYAQAAVAGGMFLANAPSRVSKIVGDSLYRGLGTNQANVQPGETEFVQGVSGRVGQTLPALAPDAVAGLAGGGDQSAFSKAHYDVIKELAVPELRYNLWKTRQQHPVSMGLLDAWRSATPVGAALTVGKKLWQTDQEPDYARAIGNAVDRHAAEIAAHPAETVDSPFFRAWQRSVLPANSLRETGEFLSRFQPRPESPAGKALAQSPDAQEALRALRAVARTTSNQSEGPSPMESLRDYQAVPGSQVDRFLNQSPAARTSLDLVQSAARHPYATAGLAAGGGLLAGGLGAALGHGVIPDREEDPYETRRRNENLRNLLTTLGAVTGAVGAPLAAHYLSRSKQSAAGWRTPAAIEFITAPRSRKNPVRKRRAPSPPPIPQETAQQEYERTMATLSEGEHRTRPKAAALRTDVPALSDYQQRVTDRLNAPQSNGRLLVYHGLGSGKTRSAITAAENSGDPYVAVVPAALRPNFRGEQQRWTDGTTPSDVLSYNQAGQGKAPTVAPETLIVDEAQRIRTPGSDQSRAVADLADQAKRVLLLSGTPVVNTPGDLATPLSLLTGESITPEKFEKRYVGTETVHPGLWGWLQGVKPVQVPKLQHEDELAEKFRGHVDYQPSRNPEGVTTHDERIPVEMSPAQQSVYRLLWNKVPWLLRWKLERDFPLSKEDAKRLSSFFSGPRQAALSVYPFQRNKDPLSAFHSSAKLTTAFNKLKETLDRDPRHKGIVYSNFPTAGLVPYAAGLQEAGVPYALLDGTLSDEERKAELARFNAGQARALLIGPSAAEGISTKGTQLIQLLDPHWNQARMNQARGRGLRFDSHEGLPPELRDVAVQRFVGTMPEPGFFGKLLQDARRPTADEVIERQSQRKEELLNQFRGLLQRVGSEPVGS